MLQGTLRSVSCTVGGKNPLISDSTRQRGITLLPPLSDHNVLVYNREKLKELITVSTLERGSRLFGAHSRLFRAARMR